MESKYRVGDTVKVTSENTFNTCNHWANDEIKTVCSPIEFYKVGDKVRIKPELKNGGVYGNVYFMPLMSEYKGNVVEVKEKIGVNYRLTNCGDWVFSGEMLEPVEEPVMIKVKSKTLKLFL